jgi:hypothetical protein
MGKGVVETGFKMEKNQKEISKETGKNLSTKSWGGKDSRLRTS